MVGRCSTNLAGFSLRACGAGDHGTEASFSSLACNSGSVTDCAADRNASRPAGERGACGVVSGGGSGKDATLSVSSRAGMPALFAAASKVSVSSRSLAFQTGELTRKTSVSSRTLANTQWLARAGGKNLRKCASSVTNHWARWAIPPSALPAAARAVCAASGRLVPGWRFTE